MVEDQQSVTAWQRETFGETSAWHAYLRAQKEFLELGDALAAGRADVAPAECADVLITLYRVADALGADLKTEVDKKMAINRARKWAVDPTGNGQHV